MDFATLKSRLLALIGRAPADVCYELVTADLNRDLRVREMQATATLVEAASVALPAGFMEMISIYRDTDPRGELRPTADTALFSQYKSSGTPRLYSVVNGAILLSPAPSGGENLQIRYYARLADLSGDSDTNDVLTTYPSLYVYGALAHHAALIRDQEAAVVYATAYRDALRRANASDAAAQSAGPGVPVARSVA